MNQILRLLPLRSEPARLCRLVGRSLHSAQPIGGHPADAFDLGIVGCGIVGLTAAREIKLRYPGLSMVCLDKDKEVGSGQTGHNSNVVHAGIYYKPGSLKAKLCVEGSQLLYEYCERSKIPFLKNGKIIVATQKEQIPTLKTLFERSKINKVRDVRWLDSPEEIRRVEPNCRGLKAIHSPFTGVLRFQQVAQAVAAEFKALGGKVLLQREVTKIDLSSQEWIALHFRGQGERPVRLRHLITCAGLFSDRVAQMTGAPRAPVIVPFRGEYLKFKKEKNALVRANIYPVPAPNQPFLGVHFSPQLNGEVWLGPNAVPCTAREGYSYADINWRDLWQILTFPGFYRLACKYFVFGVREIVYSVFYSLQVKQLRQFIPDFAVKDVELGPRGVRAQAMHFNGQMVEDFVFDFGGKEGKGRVLNVRCAPSPAATSSFAIAKYIADAVEQQFKLKDKMK